MSKMIRLPKGSPFFKDKEKKGDGPPYYGELPTKGEIRDKLEAQMAAAMFDPNEASDTEEKLNDDIDERQLFMESMMQFLPIFKRFQHMKDPEAILQMAGPIAARTLVHCMLFGDNKIRESAASRVLDRVMGKPVERQISLLGDLHKMSEEEINRDIANIIREIPRDEINQLLGPTDQNREASGAPSLEGSPRRNED